MELRDLRNRNVIETANGNFYLVMTLFDNKMRGYVKLNSNNADEEKDPVDSELFGEPFTNNFECKVNEGYNIVRIYKDFTLKECLAEIVHKKELLTDEERAYLKILIAPFKANVKSIMKFRILDAEHIEIEVVHINGVSDDTVYLPSFEAGTCYKGLEEDVMYTLDQLGLE